MGLKEEITERILLFPAGILDFFVLGLSIEIHGGEDNKDGHKCTESPEDKVVAAWLISDNVELVWEDIVSKFIRDV